MKTGYFQWALTFLMLLAFKAPAATHYVDLNCTNPVVPYTNWVTAATNIQDAVMFAGPGDMVLVTNGVYQYGGDPIGGSNRVRTLSPILLQSVNGPEVTIIKGYQVPGTTNGASAVRCVYLNDGSTLSGFTITNGATSQSGAPNGTGGGVFCTSANCLVTNCVITGNAAYAGGGGIFKGTAVNCILAGNSAPSPGGNGGGALYSTLVNCLLTRNFSGYGGGAAGYCDLINCTVVSNSAAAYPGSANGCALKNCIVYYNYSFYTNADLGSGYVFSNCCVSFPTNYLYGANNFTNPPVFADLSSGDYHLSGVSPCINTGNNSFITNATDLDGNPRIVGAIVDVGAYEYPYAGATRYVSLESVNPVAPYTNWLTAATNIQDAVDSAYPGNTVLVSNGVYQMGGKVVAGGYGPLTNRVAVTKLLMLESVNGPEATAIQGSGMLGSTSARCVYLADGAVLSGFTLTNGATLDWGDAVHDGSGGGVWCETMDSIVTNCVLINNQAYYDGGGAFSGTLRNCQLIGNSASYDNGGGASEGRLDNCTLKENSAHNGGGANNAVLNGCTLTGNTASFEGGGSCFGTLNGCTLSTNTAQAFGGGAYSSVLNNCLLTGNSAFYGGGASMRSGGALTNCTVTGNSASFGGGVDGGFCVNSIIYYNSAQNSGSNYGGSIFQFCDTTPLPSGILNIDNEPAFVDLANGDFHLSSNSPCINSGVYSSVTSATDLDGNPRIVGGAVDMGAYECQSPVLLDYYTWLQSYGLPTYTWNIYYDSDHDGMNNYEEWIAGTIPINASSLLKMLNPVPTNNPTGIIVSWQSVTNRTYFLQSSANLAAQPAFSILQSNIVGQLNMTSYRDTNAVGNGPFFYRVGVEE